MSLSTFMQRWDFLPCLTLVVVLFSVLALDRYPACPVVIPEAELISKRGPQCMDLQEPMEDMQRQMSHAQIAQVPDMRKIVNEYERLWVACEQRRVEFRAEYEEKLIREHEAAKAKRRKQ